MDGAGGALCFLSIWRFCQGSVKSLRLAVQILLLLSQNGRAYLDVWCLCPLSSCAARNACKALGIEQVVVNQTAVHTQVCELVEGALGIKGKDRAPFFMTPHIVKGWDSTTHFFSLLFLLVTQERLHSCKIHYCMHSFMGASFIFQALLFLL